MSIPSGCHRGLVAAALLLCASCSEPDSLPGAEPLANAVTTVRRSAPGEMNRCDPAEATDASGRAQVEIVFGQTAGYSYVPACVAIDAGSRIVFKGPFTLHPLVAGVENADGSFTLDGESPIGRVSEGTEASFAFDRAGSFGFYCDMHAVDGMLGAIIVR